MDVKDLNQKYKFFAESAIKLLDGLEKEKFSLFNIYPPEESTMVELHYQLTDQLMV